MNKEREFFNTLKDLFVGAKVEGESGYIFYCLIKKGGVVHKRTSFYFVLVRQGTCSPILQLDEGLQTQPTYNGLSRKSSNSTEGLEAQVK